MSCSSSQTVGSDSSVSHDTIFGWLQNQQADKENVLNYKESVYVYSYTLIGKHASVHFKEQAIGNAMPLEWSQFDEHWDQQMLQKEVPHSTIVKRIKTETWVAGKAKLFLVS